MPTDTFLNLPEEKRRRIIEAAIEEFGQRGLAAGNLSNIVKAADISRGSLYQYFPTKEDLYVYLFDLLRGERAEYVRPAFALYKKAPFLKFFEDFYLRDSEYLLNHSAHIELGKHLYSGNDNVSRGLIQRLQTRYGNWFVVGIEFDKDRGLIDLSVSTSALSDLCVHFVTDIFIFQNVHNRFSLSNIRDHTTKMLYILQNGIAAKPAPGAPD